MLCFSSRWDLPPDGRSAPKATPAFQLLPTSSLWKRQFAETQWSLIIKEKEKRKKMYGWDEENALGRGNSLSNHCQLTLTLVFLKPNPLQCLAFAPTPWCFTQTETLISFLVLTIQSLYYCMVLLHPNIIDVVDKWWPGSLNAISRENKLKVNNIYCWSCLR